MEFIKLFLLSLLVTVSMLSAPQAYAIPCNGVNDTTTCGGTASCVEAIKAGAETKCFFFWCWEEGVTYTQKDVFECSNSCGAGTDRACFSNQTCTAGLCVNNLTPVAVPPACEWWNLKCHLNW